MEIWEKQTGESVHAFEAFAIYRDLGISRSFSKVCEQLGKSNTLMCRWSSRWQWVARCAAYDSYLDRQRRKVQEREIIEAKNRYVALSRGVLSKLATRLNNLSGEEIPVTMIDRLLKTASDLELRALGESERVELTGAQGGPIKTEMKVSHDAINDPEILRLLDAISQRMEVLPSSNSS